MSGDVSIEFHGVRGSTPCSGAQYERYGGNTSCVSFTAPDHEPILFDLGTGLRPYGEQVLADAGDGCGTGPFPFHAHALLTHLHWDHVQGLPFFGPLLRPGGKLEIYGPRCPDAPLHTVFDGMMRPPYFPITTGDLAGSVIFHDAGDDAFSAGDAKVHTRWVRHTGPTLGFRVELHGVSVAYISDHGPGCSDDDDNFIPDDVLDLCDGVDLLIHDAQHTCSEFARKRDWGHCTCEYAVHVAAESGVKRLALFHHDPSHDDDQLDRMLRDARDFASASGSTEVHAAYEGLCIPLAQEHPR